MKNVLCVTVAFVLLSGQAEAKIGDALSVSGKQAVIYAAPNTASSKVMNVDSKSKLIEMERQAGWVLVTARPSGVQGWMEVKSIKAAKRAPLKRAASSPATARKALSALGPVRTVTLEDLGYRKGHTFRGSQAGHVQDFYFKTPMDSSVRGGVFRLSYRASPMLHGLSNIRVFVNDVPLTQIVAKSDNLRHEDAIVLPASMFRGGMVKVSVESGTLVDKNLCLDIRSGGGFLHILPDTAMDITYSSIDRSIRDTWRMLPHTVSVSLPAGKLDAAQFAAAMSVMELLTNAGRKIDIKRLPEVGNIVIASKSDIVAEFNRRGARLKKGFVKLKNGDVFRTPTDNLNLVKSGGMVSLAVSEPYDVQPLYLIDGQWEQLAAGRHYDINKPDYFYSLRALPKDSNSEYFTMPLHQLNTEPHYVARETVWSTTLSPHDLPSGTRLDMLSLNIVAPVRWDADPTYELYAFLNNVLVFSKRLENDGAKHNYSIPLPVEYQQQYNNLRFVVQHDIVSGDCFGIMPTDFVQITPDTSIIVKATDTEPTKFSGLSQYFSSGFDTVIAEKFLSDPENALHLISRMAADLPIMMDYSRVSFVKESEAIDPSGPFVAFGNFNLDNIDAPVRMDKGPVEIRDKDGQSFFSLNVLPKITVAEIVNGSSAQGLLVIPSTQAQHDFSEKLRLIEGDVAFIDAHGVTLHINSKQPTLAEVYYPDTKDWFAVLGEYRFWLLGLLWFLLSLAVVYLFRIARGRHEGDDHDVEMPTTEDLHAQRMHHTNINVEDDDIPPASK
ncbi:cellulose biosynthesis cyclic di-GMP-binding regulatory protein BcsB [Mariprofundus micogutta]|nr:cellulose biosynthesis cyclic di-GMP-binding regulatory protein BcsB [Mariprofundus micogutta]